MLRIYPIVLHIGKNQFLFDVLAVSMTPNRIPFRLFGIEWARSWFDFSESFVRLTLLGKTFSKRFKEAKPQGGQAAMKLSDYFSTPIKRTDACFGAYEPESKLIESNGDMYKFVGLFKDAEPGYDAAYGMPASDGLPARFLIFIRHKDNIIQKHFAANEDVKDVKREMIDRVNRSKQ